MNAATTVYIGLGSNLDDPLKHVLSAIKSLELLAVDGQVESSKIYRSAPIGPPQPHYINAVARFTTQQAPTRLLLALQSIEQDHQRERLQHWGPRTLDLDLLLYGDVQQDDPALTLPHPRIAERAFVLKPLLDLDPELRLPTGRWARDCLKSLPDADDTEEL